MHTRLPVGLDALADSARSMDAQARRMGVVPPAAVVESASRLADIASRGPEARILNGLDRAEPAIMGLVGRLAR